MLNKKAMALTRLLLIDLAKYINLLYRVNGTGLNVTYILLIGFLVGVLCQI